MLEKLDKKQEAAGLQYIRRFLVPMCAKEWSEDWQPVAQAILKDLRRMEADVPILGKGMSDMLFYRAMIKTFPEQKGQSEFIFRIGKFNGGVVVSYYTQFSESKWYRIDETPDKSAVRRITEGDGWEGPEIGAGPPPLTRIEEAEALQFIRNIAIPYTVDHIYNVFLALQPSRPTDEYPRVGYDTFREKLKKVRHDPNSIEYIVDLGPHVYFKYYVQKHSGLFGVRVMIHHQLPSMAVQKTHKTNDVVLYIGKGKQPSWFQKLGYIKEAHNPVMDTDDINREEEQDATSTFMQTILGDAVTWFNQRSSWSGIKHREVTVDEVKRGFRKIIRDKDLIVYRFSLSGSQDSDDQIWFGISKKIFDNHIISIGYHVGKMMQNTVGYDKKNCKFHLENDYKTGWIWRQYMPDRKQWDVFLEGVNETLIGPDGQLDVSKIEESRAVQWIKEYLFTFVAEELKYSEQVLRNTFRKIKQDTEIWYQSKTGSPNFPDLVFGIFKNDKNELVVSVDNEPSWHMEFVVGQKKYLAHFNENDGGKYPGESDEAYVNRMVKISPREEAEGLFYIKKFLFEKAANFWNGMMSTGNYRELYVSPETIAANFKKIERLYIPPERYMERHAHEKITYISLIPEKKYDSRNHIPRVTKYTKKKDAVEGIKFIFYTSKDGEGRLFVSFIPPGRNDAGLCYGLEQLRNPKQLQESVEKVKRVSKKEEAEGLQYIKRYMIPIAVKKHNEASFPRNYITEEEIRKHLKKTGEYFASTGNQGNPMIVFSSNFRGLNFAFVLCKDLTSGRLYTRWSTPSAKTFLGYNVGEPPNLTESDENPNPHKTISKMDELRSVDYIKKLIIPLAVKRWNRLYTPHGELAIEKVRKTMRKKEHHSWPKIISDFVVYTSETTIPELHFHWEIWKDGVGKLMVGWKISNEENLWHTYPVGDPSPLGENVDAERLKKSYSITKMEEDRAANFIKRVLIPKLVEYVNDGSRHYTCQRQITVDEVNKTFKKVGSWDSKYGYKREIQYQALFLGEPFLFDIFKDNGKMMVLQKSDGTTHRVT